MTITQRDIARKLQVSVSLVSRVLSGKARHIGIRPETILRIRETARAMGYVPSAAALSLKGASTKTIGVVVYDFDDPFLGLLIGELQRQSHRQHYSLILVGFEQRRVEQRDLLPLHKYRLDGLIVLGSEDPGAWTREFAENGLPMVRIGAGPRCARVPDVRVDAEHGIRILLTHLADLGHRRFGFVGASPTVHTDRFAVFLRLAQAMGLRAHADWSAISNRPLPQAGMEAGQSLVKKSGGNLPTALLASSDIVALGTIRALTERGLSVPGDVSVVGFDDIPLAELVTPALTTVRQPIAEMAEASFNLLFHDPSGDRDRSTVARPELVVRESSAPPRTPGVPP